MILLSILSSYKTLIIMLLSILAVSVILDISLTVIAKVVQCICSVSNATVLVIAHLLILVINILDNRV